jgi:hypothetical protein
MIPMLTKVGEAIVVGERNDHDPNAEADDKACDKP